MKGIKKFSIVIAFAFASAFMVDVQGAMTQQENDGSYYVIHNSMLGWNKARMVAGSGGQKEEYYDAHDHLSAQTAKPLDRSIASLS